MDTFNLSGAESASDISTDSDIAHFYRPGEYQGQNLGVFETRFLFSKSADAS